MTDHVFMGSPYDGGEVCTYGRDGLATCGFSPEDHIPRKRKVNLPPEPAQSEAETAFSAYAEAVQTLVRAKDKAYGGAWQKQGYMGNLARIMSKVARLQAMLWSDQADHTAWSQETDESVTDTLKDLMALAAFMAANIEDGNRWGK